MIVNKGQGIFDITVQFFGTLDNLFDFLNDNNLSLNSKLKSGQEVLIDNIGKGNENVKNFILLNNLKLNNNQEKLLPPTIGGSYSNSYSNSYN